MQGAADQQRGPADPHRPPAGGEGEGGHGRDGDEDGRYQRLGGLLGAAGGWWR